MKENKIMKIAELQHPPKNVRKHPKKQIEEMKRSIDKFGQFRPVVIDENNVILAGNGLVMALREMGAQDVEVLQYDNLSENDKKKLMIADNQVSNLGSDDFLAIEEIIKSLDGDLDIPGYDTEALEILVADSDEITREVMEYGTFSQEETKSIRANEGFEHRPVEQTYQQTQSRQAVDSYQQGQGAFSGGEERVQAYKEDVQVGDVQRFVICPHCGEKIFLE